MRARDALLRGAAAMREEDAQIARMAIRELQRSEERLAAQNIGPVSFQARDRAAVLAVLLNPPER